jgi:cytochrome c-type biogenesis protein CcmF
VTEAPLPPAAPWSLLTGQVGSLAVWVSLALFVAACLLAGFGRQRPACEAWAVRAFVAGGCGFFASFAALTALFVRDQFQYRYVFGHGAADHELKYKIAGVWSGQEGSILLWGVCTSAFLLLALRAVGPLRRLYVLAGSGILAGIAAILAFESPFRLADPVGGQFLVPETGRGMAPSLLNYWVTIHPPTIFLGFGSLAVLFAWAMASAWSRDADTWLRPIRPWAITSATLLGLGLCMGGFWAYETLGWGGFWMWDPVENTSFVPWCATAALIHGLYVQAATGRWRVGNIALAGLPFVLFGYGTFLTRSGFLGDTSVHSFAEMDRAALWLLIAMVSATLIVHVASWIYAAGGIQGPVNRPPEKGVLDRASFLSAGSWLLGAFGVCTAFGMSVPLVQSLAGQAPKVVEERLYNSVLAWFFVPIMLVMALGPFLSWRAMGFRAVLGRIANALAVSIGLVGVILLWLKHPTLAETPDPAATSVLLLRWEVPQLPWVMFLTWLCVFTAVSALWRLGEMAARSKGGIGAMLTHFGVALTVLGLVFSRGLEQRREVVIGGKQTAEAFGYRFSADGWTTNLSDRNNRLLVTAKGKGQTYQMRPGLYFLGFDQAGDPRPMIWPAVQTTPLYDIYLVAHTITFDASGETPMKPGEVRLLRAENLLVRYEGLRTEGALGTADARFYAKVQVTTEEGIKTVEPMVRLGADGLEQTPAEVGDYSIALTRIDAATKTAYLQVRYKDPAFACEVFYKPLTLAVWLGVGIMTLGGGLAAWNRRTRRRTLTDGRAEASDVEPEPTESDATQTVAPV